MKLRRLQPADAGAYRELMLAGYAAHPYGFTATVPEREDLPLAWWEARLQTGDAATEIVLGAFIEERLIGAVGVRFNARPKTRHKAWLFGMLVDSARTGNGAGAALVRQAVAESGAREGVVLIQLCVIEGNARALHLYERAGFRQFGFEPFAVRNDDGYKGDIHMWMPLANAPIEVALP